MKVNQEIIVQAALTLLQQIGLEQLTLRRLAVELGIQAPTLYWHFKSKEDLIDAMATTILAEAASTLLPARPSANWKTCIRTFAHGLRALLLAHRDGARLVAGSRLRDTRYMEITERIGTRLVQSGFSTRQTVVLISSVYTFTIGFVVEEQAVFPLPGQRSPAYDLTRRSAALDPKRFPLTRRSGAILFNRFDLRYKESIALILNGAAPSPR